MAQASKKDTASLSENGGTLEQALLAQQTGDTYLARKLAKRALAQPDKADAKEAKKISTLLFEEVPATPTAETVATEIIRRTVLNRRALTLLAVGATLYIIMVILGAVRG